VKQATVLCISLSALMTATAVAQPSRGLPAGAPFAAIQDQLKEISARVTALEGDSHSPPNSSVEGRTYCAQLSTTSFLGAPELPLGADRVDILRIEVSFNGGVVSGHGVSNWQASMNANNQVDLTRNPPPFGDLGALVGQAYSQSGRRIDLMVGPAAWTLYVSADGSLIHGQRIFKNQLPVVSIAGLSTIVYVEDATGAGCNPEVILF